MIGDIPIVTKVRPAGSRTLHVRFAGDRRAYVVALTGLIARSKHFAPLMEDCRYLRKARYIGRWHRCCLAYRNEMGPPRPFKFNAARDRGRAVADEGRELFEMAKIFGSVTH